MPDRASFSQSNIRPHHDIIALSQSISDLFMFFNVAATFKIYMCHHKENQEDTLSWAQCHLFAGWGSQHWSPRTGARMWSEISWSMILTIVVKVIIMIINISISPSDWRQTRAKSPSCPAASSRTLLSDLSPRSPCDQSEDMATCHWQVYYFPSKIKHFCQPRPSQLIRIALFWTHAPDSDTAMGRLQQSPLNWNCGKSTWWRWQLWRLARGRCNKSSSWRMNS